jgi:hypothetical protein
MVFSSASPPNHFTLTVNKLVQYDPKANPNAPVGNAHSAGTYLDGTASYVGVGHTTSFRNFCDNQQTLPARVSTKAGAAGAYGECGQVLYDDINPWYLKDDPNFVWVPATPATVLKVPNGVVYDTTTGYRILFGRVNITSANGTKFTVVSKVHLDHYINVLFYMDEFNRPAQSSNFEVLTCYTTSELVGLF